MIAELGSNVDLRVCEHIGADLQPLAPVRLSESAHDVVMCPPVSSVCCLGRSEATRRT
jgi:hypothetical protein